MTFTVGSIPVLQTQISKPEAPDSYYGGFQPSTQTLPKGHKRLQRSRAFAVDAIYERDIEIPLRDGTKLRADVFRPAEAEAEGKKIPALLIWSPYGKTGTGMSLASIYFVNWDGDLQAIIPKTFDD